MSTPQSQSRSTALAKPGAQGMAAQSASPPSPITLFNRTLKQMEGQIKNALPRHITPERMMRVALTAVSTTPKLLECSQVSVMGCIVQAAQLGLEPGSGLGHAYLVPFGKTCQLIIGYRGMVDLARRSGEIVSISARAVYAKDEFSYAYGLDETLHHVPSTDAERGPLTFVYAVAKLKGGGVQFEVLSRSDVDRIRKMSRAGNSGPWVEHYDEMAKKSAVRRLFKMLPVSIELAKAVRLDEAVDDDQDQLIDVFTQGPAEDVPGSDADGQRQPLEPKPEEPPAQQEATQDPPSEAQPEPAPPPQPSTTVTVKKRSLSDTTSGEG